jgi:peptidoglycan/LPS O-acetylase OafA/YrhL
MHTIAGGRATAPPVDDRPQLARSVLVRPARRAPSLRGDIQGMRALAVLLVLFAHAGIRGFAGGYVGVDVFFVVSGFLITGILVREVRRTGRVSISGFYARRARRILPAATVTLVVIAVVSGAAFTYARVDEVLAHVGWAAVFAANIRSARSGTDYFATDAFVSPVQHYWSLAVEEQFYLLWPALIAVLVLTIRPGGGRSRVHVGPPAWSDTSRRLRRVALVIVVLSLLSFAWSVRSTATDPQPAYFSTLARGWELGAGAALALAAGRLERLPGWVKALASWAGLAAIAVAAVGFTAATPFPGYLAAVPVLGATLVLAGGIHGPAYGAALVLDRQPMRWIGDISYSLYLWHWPVLMLPATYLARDLTLTERLALMATAVLIAAASYRFVETPVRRARSLSAARVRSLLLWPVAVAVVIAAALVVHERSGGPAAPPPGTPYVAPAVDPEPTTTQESKDTAVNDAGFAAELARAGHPLPATLRPSLAKLHDDVSRAPAGCYAERNDLRHKICVLGDTKGTRTMVLYGDSHVTMWLDPLLRMARTGHWRIVVFMKASCLPVDATEYRVDERRPYTECDRYRQWAYAEMAKLKPQRIVISGLLAQNFADPADGSRMLTIDDARPIFAAGALHALKTLRTISRQIYVIGGTPQLDREPAECLASRKATMATCAVALDRRTSERNQQWRQAAAATGAHFVDPVPWFCDQRTCPVVIRDVIVYRDTNHVTRTFAATLKTGLGRKLGL